MQISANDIFNNMNLTNSMLRRIADLLIDSLCEARLSSERSDNEATTRLDYADLIAWYLNENTEITRVSFYEILDLLNPLNDLQLAVDLDARLVSSARVITLLKNY